MKTNREILEHCAINKCLKRLQALGYSPKTDTWHAYCQAFGDKLNAALISAEIDAELNNL